MILRAFQLKKARGKDVLDRECYLICVTVELASSVHTAFSNVKCVFVLRRPVLQYSSFYYLFTPLHYYVLR